MQVPNTDKPIKSLKELSRATTTELTDSEVQDAFKIIVDVQQRYATRTATEANLMELRDEVLTRLAEKNVLATFDPVPILNNEPPVVEIIGKVPSDPQHVYGHDHEKAAWEVTKASKRNEEVLGQKEPINKRKAK